MKVNKKKIGLFITPPSYYRAAILPQLGLLSIASAVKNFVEIHYLDCNAEKIKLQSLVKKIKVTPDFIAVSGQYTRDHQIYIEIAKILKNNLKKVPLIIGGAHANRSYNSLLKEGYDYVVIGEGEITFTELIEFIKGDLNEGITQIRGIAYKNGNKIIVNKRRPLIKNLDDLPLIDWAIIDERKYTSPFKKLSLIETSRGCTSKCSFCSPALLFNHTFRS